MQPRKGEEARECEREGCRCPIELEWLSVTLTDENSPMAHYCSEECARGEGCGHVECACGALLDA